MESGKLRHKIEFQESTETRNNYGEITLTWSTFSTTWSNITPLSGKEYWDAKQVNAENTLKFEIRYLPGLDSVMRIVWESRFFYIESIMNHNARNKMTIVRAVENA